MIEQKSVQRKNMSASANTKLFNFVSHYYYKLLIISSITSAITKNEFELERY